MERTTMNITQTKEPPQPVELKIKVRSPVSRPAIMLQTKGDENGVVGESGEELDPDAGGRSSGEESPGAHTDAARSPQVLLEKAPLSTQRLTREVRVLPAMVLPMPKWNTNSGNQNGRKDSASEDEWHSPAGKPSSPPSSIHQKPPLP